MSIVRETKQQYVGVDRLSSLPEALVIHILSFLDTKYAVQASLSLKKWVHLWTLIPNLDFNCSVFRKLSSFHTFVDKVLTLRDDSVKINKFSYSRKRGTKSKLLERVTKYAVSHDVQQLNICGYGNRENIFKDQLGSCNSIRSLKIKSFSLHDSLCLENLVTLHLEGVGLIGLGNLSGFPNLQTLTLEHCSSADLDVGLISPTIVAPQLLRLSILHCFRSASKLMLSTPRLTFFKMEGSSLPLFQSDELTVLNTVDIDIDMYNKCAYDQSRQLVPRLMNMLMCFYNVNSLRLSSSLFELISMFPDVLAREPSPFCNLKSLNIVQSKWCTTSTLTFPGHVMAYLLRNPDANTVLEINLPRCKK